MTDRDRPTLDVKAAADYLGLPVKTLYNLVEAGRIESVRLTRRLQFSEAALDRFIEANTRKSADAPAARMERPTLVLPATRRLG